MNNSHLTNRVRKVLCLIFCAVIILTFFLGCQEKKAALKAAGPAGTCEILDKLPKDLAKPVEVSYSNKINLLGVTVNKVSTDKLSVSYYWRPMDELESYNTVFVHFTDKDNKAIFQNDHAFCPQKSFEELKGKVVKETFNVDFLKKDLDKEIFIKIGFYDLKSGGRLKIASANGIPTDDDNTRAIIESLKL